MHIGLAGAKCLEAPGGDIAGRAGLLFRRSPLGQWAGGLQSGLCQGVGAPAAFPHIA